MLPKVVNHSGHRVVTITINSTTNNGNGDKAALEAKSFALPLQPQAMTIESKEVHMVQPFHNLEEPVVVEGLDYDVVKVTVLAFRLVNKIFHGSSAPEIIFGEVQYSYPRRVEPEEANRRRESGKHIFRFDPHWTHQELCLRYGFKVTDRAKEVGKALMLY